MALGRTNRMLNRRKVTKISDQISTNYISKLLCRCFSSFISTFQNSCHGHRVRPLERAREDVVRLWHLEQEAEGSFLPLELIPPLGRMLWRHEKRGGKAVLWKELPQYKYKWFIYYKANFFWILYSYVWYETYFAPAYSALRKLMIYK